MFPKMKKKTFVIIIQSLANISYMKLRNFTHKF